MPSLPDQYINAEAADKTKYEQKVTCGVTTDGIFTIGIPEDLVEILKDNGVESGRYFNAAGFRYSYFRGLPRLECKKLADGTKLLCACAKQLITAETKTERVIVYATQIGVSFWIDGKGNFCQNGSVEMADDGGQWWQPKTRKDFHADKGEMFSVGLAASVFDKITHKRKSGDRIEWQYVRDTDDESIDALNSFAGASVDPEHGNHFEMPYSPKAAEFFTAALFAICKMAHGLDGFFADKKRLELSINKGVGLLSFNAEIDDKASARHKQPESASVKR